MTTIERLANINVTINFEIPMECLTIDDFADMDDAKCEAMYTSLQMVQNPTREQDEAFWTLSRYFDEKYYFDNIDAFNEYRSHMDEPDFDWDFYSDWHKDMYGFRPH